jgi:hypothetical protein
MSKPDPRPTFLQIRRQHGISLEVLMVDIEGILPKEEIDYFDQTGRGRPCVVDAYLNALSCLTGQQYTREDVGYITLLTEAQIERAMRYRVSQRLLAVRDKHRLHLGELFADVGTRKSEKPDDAVLACIISAIPIALEDARKVQKGVERMAGMEYSFDELGMIIEKQEGRGLTEN